jgi:hypothetical protein
MLTRFTPHVPYLPNFLCEGGALHCSPIANAILLEYRFKGCYTMRHHKLPGLPYMCTLDIIELAEACDVRLD